MLLSYVKTLIWNQHFFYIKVCYRLFKETVYNSKDLSSYSLKVMKKL